MFWKNSKIIPGCGRPLSSWSLPGSLANRAMHLRDSTALPPIPGVALSISGAFVRLWMGFFQNIFAKRPEKRYHHPASGQFVNLSICRLRLSQMASGFMCRLSWLVSCCVASIMLACKSTRHSLHNMPTCCLISLTIVIVADSSCHSCVLPWVQLDCTGWCLTSPVCHMTHGSWLTPSLIWNVLCLDTAEAAWNSQMLLTPVQFFSSPFGSFFLSSRLGAGSPLRRRQSGHSVITDIYIYICIYI